VSLRYLLDTNIVSDLVRNTHGRIAAKIAEAGEESVCIDLIIAGEIHFGLAKRNSPRLTIQAERILEALPVLPMESPTERHYAAIRHALQTEGTPIGPNDLWIAAHACSRNLTLVTANTSEFTRVPNLTLENWLE
jgi:tRNA(fMet)-specific endonuclease VapC